jgi:hypothetical protein
MVVIPQNDRECQHAFALDSPGVAPLPRASELDALEFFDVVSELLTSQARRRELHDALIASDVRGGIERTLAVIARAVTLRRDAR